MKAFRPKIAVCILAIFAAQCKRERATTRQSYSPAGSAALMFEFRRAMGKGWDDDGSHFVHFHAFPLVSTPLGAYIFANVDFEWRAAGYDQDLARGEHRLAVFRNGTLIGQYLVNTDIAESACRVAAQRLVLCFVDGHTLSLDVSRGPPDNNDLDYLGIYNAEPQSGSAGPTNQQ